MVHPHPVRQEGINRKKYFGLQDSMKGKLNLENLVPTVKKRDHGWD